MDLFKQYLEKTGVYGKVREVKHPLVYIEGLPEVRPNETIIFESGQKGMIMDIEEDQVHAMLFSNTPVPIGMQVTRSMGQMRIPVGADLLGKTVDALGNVIAGATDSDTPSQEWPIFFESPGIANRVKIEQPFITGVTKVDLLIPLGKGQRELILGDVKTGKTSLLLSALRSQVHLDNAIAVYAAIGKRKSEIKQLTSYFQENKMADKAVIVASSASDSPSLIYLTPYAAMSIAESFKDQGKDVVIIMDDLSTHAENYREISLLSRRFPGRASYPGDIFYAHASLMERAGSFKHPEKKSVTITCLPIATTVEGDLTGYISTNLMGMTDGHIFFDVDMYNKGHRPAINIPISVTRVGRQTQNEFLRAVNVEILSTLSQYDKLQNIAHLGSELSGESKRILEKGKALHIIMHQEKSIVPYPLQIILFGIVWLSLCKIDSDKIFQDILAKLITMYKEPNGRAVIEQLLQADSLSKFLLQLKQNQQITQICTTKTA